MLKLFFGSQARREDLVALAAEQHAAHQRRVRGVRGARTTPSATGPARWELATLEVGMRYERMAAEFWAEVLDRARSDLAGVVAERPPDGRRCRRSPRSDTRGCGVQSRLRGSSPH